MVTLESNSVQSATATPFDRPTQASQPPAESVAQAPRAEYRESIPLRDPFWFMSLVVAGASIGSLWGLGALTLAILGLSASRRPISCRRPASFSVWHSWRSARSARLGAHVSIRGTCEFPGSDRFLQRRGRRVGRGTCRSRPGHPEFGGPWGRAVHGSGRHLARIGLALAQREHAAREPLQPRPHLSRRGRTPAERPVCRQRAFPGAVRDFLIGLGATILGILAMMHIAPVTLGFVALLALGGALAFTASTICGAGLATLQEVCSKR